MNQNNFPEKALFESNAQWPPHIKHFKMNPNPLPLLELLQGSIPMREKQKSQKKVSRQSGQVDLLLDVNHLY